jgi:MFS transporter, MHS family, proline/betaine transporter
VRHKVGSAKLLRRYARPLPNGAQLCASSGLGAVGAVGFYMSFVYVTTYLRQIDHIAQSTALDINTISMAALLLLLAPIGAVSDLCGRKPVLLAAAGGMFIMAWPLFWMLHHHAPFVSVLGQPGFAVLSACF